MFACRWSSARSAIAISLPSEIAMLEERVRSFLETLQRKYPDLRVTVLTSLADGADRLVADVANR